MSDIVKVDGVKIVLSGKEYVLPPLTFSKMPKINALMEGGTMSPEFVETLINAIHWSLQRNYPTLLREEVDSSVDILNWKVVLDAFMSVNGFSATGNPPGEVVGAERPSVI